MKFVSMSTWYGGPSAWLYLKNRADDVFSLQSVSKHENEKAEFICLKISKPTALYSHVPNLLTFLVFLLGPFGFTAVREYQPPLVLGRRKGLEENTRKSNLFASFGFSMRLTCANLRVFFAFPIPPKQKARQSAATRSDRQSLSTGHRAIPQW